MDKYTEDMLARIDSSEKLTEKELSTLVYEFKEVAEIEGDHRRWAQSMQTIVQLGERLFSITWDRGLTENQEDEFYDQPVEVEPRTYEKTITVTEWVAVERSGK